MAILAQSVGGSLILNELAETRADLLSSLFPAFPVTRFDAAQIDDHLAQDAIPSVVLMNPPFSVMANVEGRMADAAYRHVASALARLAPGGQDRGRVVFTAAIDGAVFAKHGTSIDTRLTVIDKLPADDPSVFPASPGIAPDVVTLLGWIESQLPPRLPVSLPKLASAPGPTGEFYTRQFGIDAAPRTAWAVSSLTALKCLASAKMVRPLGYRRPSAGACFRSARSAPHPLERTVSSESQICCSLHERQLWWMLEGRAAPS